MIIVGSSYVPSIPLLQGGGPPQPNRPQHDTGKLSRLLHCSGSKPSIECHRVPLTRQDCRAIGSMENLQGLTASSCVPHSHNPSP